MIIVGAYADCLPSLEADRLSPIARLDDFVNSLMPPEIALHILPFYPSAGDFGFAPNDLYEVRTDLGTWADIKQCAEHRRLIVDGIYNHVGVDHIWIKSFLEDPGSGSDLLHAYHVSDASLGPMSPRGQPVLRRYDVNGEAWYLWQTFSEYAVDIRLDQPAVVKEVDRNAKFLAENCIWGVRLDAVAYYAKALGAQVRHNPGVYQLSEKIAELIRGHGLAVMAQLDCDKDGLKYYREDNFRTIPICDFAFSTYLALAVIDSDARILAHYLNNRPEGNRVLIRAPRTHDGILLRSGRLSDDVVDRIISRAADWGVAARYSGGKPYELNCSAPYLYGRAHGHDNIGRLVELTTVVTALSGGWSYLYLPFLLGYVPEDEASPKSFENDPRALNRSSISRKHLLQFMTSGQPLRVRTLLTVLARVHEEIAPDASTCAVVSEDHPSLLQLEESASGIGMLGNFAPNRGAPIPPDIGETLASKGANSGVLQPFGYIIYRKRTLL